MPKTPKVSPNPVPGALGRRPRVRLARTGLTRTTRWARGVLPFAGQHRTRPSPAAPDGFGSSRTGYRYDVIFLLPPLTPGAAIERVGPKEGVDQAHAGLDVLYSSRLIERASQRRLTRVVSSPVYQRMTVRNWRTTKLLDLMDTGG